MKFKATFVRTVTEIYEVEIEAENEEEVVDKISEGKYGDKIDSEELIESYSDDIEVTDIEEIDE